MGRTTTISRIEPPDGQHTLIERLEAHVGMLTVPDVARLLGKNRTTVYLMVKQRLIPSVNDGSRDIRIDPKTYATFLRELNPMMAKASRPRTFQRSA